jgi:C-terminal processing protease CtpA/Prc
MNSFLLSLLKYHRIGTLIGTPSSGGYMCSDASREAVLKNTGLRLRYSTHAFKTAVEGQKPGIGIEPDILVEWSLEDYIVGNDPVLAAAVEATRMGTGDN